MEPISSIHERNTNLRWPNISFDCMICNVSRLNFKYDHRDPIRLSPPGLPTQLMHTHTHTHTPTHTPTHTQTCTHTHTQTHKVRLKQTHRDIKGKHNNRYRDRQ